MSYNFIKPYTFVRILKEIPIEGKVRFWQNKDNSKKRTGDKRHERIN